VKTTAQATGIHHIEPECVPNPAALDAWSGHSWDAGVQVDRLRDLDTVRVCTRNTVYEITVVSAETGESVVVGGRFFPEHRRAVILGCSLGGAFLKLRGIYCGFSLELYSTGTRIVTSAVQSVEVIGDRHLGTVQ
jgi:hypothetical protein